MSEVYFINLIVSLVIFLFGKQIGDKGYELINKRINILNIFFTLYYLDAIIISNEKIRYKIWKWITELTRDTMTIVLLDKISIIMTTLILLIGYIVIRYSYWYISEASFKGILYVFKVTMIILVSSKTILGIYIGWEWVGVMSYLLISYWNLNIKNVKSGEKAILYNKVGDLGMILLVISLYNNLNSTIDTIITYPTNKGTYNEIINNVIIISILLAAIAKSAQFIADGWLGDAMAGPTPVSALLHAATMVTGGVILLYRTIIFNNNNIWEYGAIIGLITIIYGGLVAITQNDLKKIIAYSTCSQLGYMFFIAIFNIGGVELSLYHLTTHAFFKALLFLSAGLIIHYLDNEQDLREILFTVKGDRFYYPLFFFASLSLMALPYTSGYYSKETIIYSLYNREYFLLTTIGALFTVVYTLRILKVYSLKYLLPQMILVFPLKYYSLLFILLYGSISLGYSLSNMIIGVYNCIITTSDLLLYLSLIIIMIIYLTPELLYTYYLLYEILYQLYLTLNKRTFTDIVINKMTEELLEDSYQLYKNIDKGILEYIGGTGLYKLINNNNKFIISNLNKYYLLISFILLIFVVIFITNI